MLEKQPWDVNTAVLLDAIPLVLAVVNLPVQEVASTVAKGVNTLVTVLAKALAAEHAVILHLANAADLRTFMKYIMIVRRYLKFNSITVKFNCG